MSLLKNRMLIKRQKEPQDTVREEGDKIGDRINLNSRMMVQYINNTSLKMILKLCLTRNEFKLSKFV